jgi:hypothetical protein
MGLLLPDIRPNKTINPAIMIIPASPISPILLNCRMGIDFLTGLEAYEHRVEGVGFH